MPLQTMQPPPRQSTAGGEAGTTFGDRGAPVPKQSTALLLVPVAIILVLLAAIAIGQIGGSTTHDASADSYAKAADAAAEAADAADEAADTSGADDGTVADTNVAETGASDEAAIAPMKLLPFRGQYCAAGGTSDFVRMTLSEKQGLAIETLDLGLGEVEWKLIAQCDATGIKLVNGRWSNTGAKNVRVYCEKDGRYVLAANADGSDVQMVFMQGMVKGVQYGIPDPIGMAPRDCAGM